MNERIKILIIALCYLIAGVLLLILFYDLEVGNIVPGIPGGGTVQHQAYVLTLPALMHVMYRILKNMGARL